ncbi:hypothetical protein [Rhodanobacter geophilus]|uniref:Uncharacterized protein n=1 Tax=Rhodanobacter geophilus TaxID=3162488 RepID=A0ABV3QLR8_9GAMM
MRYGMLCRRGMGMPIIGGSDSMATRSRGAGAGFGWLTNGIRVGFERPKLLFGGAALLVVACLLPSLITVPMQIYAAKAGTPPSAATSLTTMAISLLYALLIIPLYAGYLQLVSAAERQQPARVSDIFMPYRQGEAWRLIGLGLANFVVYIGGIAIIVLAAGRGIIGWYMQALAAQASHQLPPALPGSFWTTMALLMVFGLWMMGFYAISLGQVALNRRSVFGAIGDGIGGALKNVLPLLVFALSSLLAWIVAIIVFLIVALLLGLIARLISPWLMVAVLVPLYIGLLLLMFTVMFGVMYHLWRDVCGDDVANAMPPPLAA